MNRPPADSVSGALARWIGALTFETMPRSIVADAKLRILDTLGVTVAASVTDAGRILRDAALNLGPGAASRILGYGDRAAPSYAAMANGAMAHVQDFDDTHSLARAHVSAPVVSCALALGEARKADGRAVLAAVVAGSETTCRLGAMAPGAFHRHGFHATGVLGAIGAACTAGKIGTLSLSALQDAIGIAASQAAGLMECFADGTWTKRLHPGWAAHCGIAAAELAARGFSGPARAIDGERGLFNAHLGAADHPFQRIAEGLGVEWLCTRSAFKPYPCGHLLHGFIEAVFNLREEAGIRADDVAKIICPIAPWVAPMIAEPRTAKLHPADEAAAKISLYYCVAAALVRDKLDLSAFAADALGDPRIAALAEKVICTVDPDAPEDQSKGWVIVETSGGERVESVATNCVGSDANPMTADDVRRKFRDNMAFAGLKGNAERVIELVERFETLANVEEPIGLCCRAGGGHS